MRSLDYSTIAAMCGGRVAQGNPSSTASAVSTDTRKIEGGELYVALEGDRFDGHAFLAQAVERGATGVMVAKVPEGGLPEGAVVVEVDDTLTGLQKLATGYRRLMGPTGVAVTGSSGKTSTKDMISSVVGVKHRVRATKGNLNNHIGLPLTLLSHEDGDAVGVWEMGMSNPGEIEVLARIAEPDIGVITNVGTAHLENMGSREAIAEEKGTLVELLDAGGCAILNANDEWTDRIAAKTSATVIRAGIDGGDVSAVSVKGTGTGSEFVLRHGGAEAKVVLPIPGRHMVQNAVLAAAVGIRLGMGLEDVAAGLASVALTGGRLQVRKVGDVIVLDDSYNANPDSMRAAVAALMEYPCEGRRMAVLGKMAELGAEAEKAHNALGWVVAEAGFDDVVVVGDEARGILDGVDAAGGSGRFFAATDEAGKYLKGESRSGDVVLIKGSRSAAMERVIEELERL